MKKILLVEDNVDNQDLILAFFDDIYEVYVCDDAFIALETLHQKKYIPDLILCDISLPGMDGMAFLQEIKNSTFNTIPIIAITSHAMKGDKERFLAAGFSSYISKPILDPEELINLVEAFIH